MRELWSEQRKFEIWLEIETLACEAMAELGQIPKEDAVEIRKRARFSIPEITEIEKRTNHDVIAFLENVAASVGPAARWIHQGLTSSDILDTTLAVQLTEAARILAEDLKRAARVVVAKQARQLQNDADDRPQPWHPRRADHVRTEARADVRRIRPRGGTARANDGAHSRRKIKRRGRHACASRSGDRARRLREARAASRRRFRRRSFSAIGTRNFAPRSRSSRRASIAGQPSFGICSEPKCSRWRNFSAQARRAAPPCRTSAIRSPAND